MFGKNARINPLASRKQLLIAESELNRAQLAENLGELKADVCALTHRAKSLSAVATSAVRLVADLATFRCGKPASEAEKPSWMNTILKGAGLISTLWQAFRPPARKSEDQ